MNSSQIFEKIRSKKSFLCVGLDSEITRIPKHLFAEDDPVFAFNKAIIDATAAFTVAYKPNTAFYEANGSKGWRSLESTISYIRINYPEMFIIADAKRGDIGNTSDNYASAFFKHLDADAVTVAPYMGLDSVHPFLGYPDKWVVLLVLTSNSGSADFQHLTDASGSPLFEIVLKKAASWATPDQMMFVAGATHPDAILRIRALVPDYFLLVPGVGAQGGDLETVAKNGLNSQGGLLINASRSIIYASSGTDFDAAAANEAKKMQQMMEKALLHKGLI